MYEETKKESQVFREAIAQSNIDTIRRLYDRVSKNPDFNSHLEFFFGLLVQPHDCLETQTKVLEINTFFLEEKRSEPYLLLFDFLNNSCLFSVPEASSYNALSEMAFSPAGLAVLYGQSEILKMFLNQRHQNGVGVYFQTAELDQRQYKTLGLLNVAEMIQNAFPPVMADMNYISDIQDCIEILLEYEEKMFYKVLSNICPRSVGFKTDPNLQQEVIRPQNSFLPQENIVLHNLIKQLVEYSDVSREHVMKDRCAYLVRVSFAVYGEKNLFNFSPEQVFTSISRFITEQTQLMDTFEMQHLLCLYVYFVCDTQTSTKEIEKERGILVDQFPFITLTKERIEAFEELLQTEIFNCFERLERTEQRRWLRSLVEKGRRDSIYFTIGSLLIFSLETREIADYVCKLECITESAEDSHLGALEDYNLPLLLPREERDDFQQELNTDLSKFNQVRDQELKFLLFVLKTIQSICKNIIESREDYNLIKFELLPNIMLQQLDCDYFTRQNHMNYLKKELAKALDLVKKCLIEENLKEKEPDAYSRINEIIKELSNYWNLFPEAYPPKASFWNELPFAEETASVSNQYVT